MDIPKEDVEEIEENEKLNEFLNFFKHFDTLPTQEELEDQDKHVGLKIFFKENMFLNQMQE